MVGENLTEFEHTRWHVIPKERYLCTNNQASSSITLCSNKSLCATCCSHKILLRRQAFQKNSWNKQKVICPCNVTYCCNMLLHLVTKYSNLLHISTEKWNVLNFSFDVVNKWRSQLQIVQDNKKNCFFFLTKPDFEKTCVLKNWSKFMGKKPWVSKKSFLN